ncbi:Helix-turn-helix domain-containing protein [Streptomyces sp. DvalAA-14]|nr:helix-turn-helix domain-containing protein [Streptomyces sp. SID4948]SCE04759.1 Helix-turn-helix domain-containing protein [Streptomyces sp. DvalAA-14]
MDRARLAAFLRTRRDTLQPEDVGLPRGRRRRAAGLRREEVAALCDVSADYYTRLEQERGPYPSQQMLSSISRGLRLSVEERDHLFRLGGYPPPRRVRRSDRIDPGIMRILDRLADTPAQVISLLGETLGQTGPAVALVGDDSGHTGLARSLHYRWFTDPDTRMIYPEDDHPMHSRLLASHLHATYAADGEGSRASVVVDTLLTASPEFASLWREHPALGAYCAPKRIVHPALGLLEVHCQILADPDRSQVLQVYTAAPGTESYDKLRQLSVDGDHVGWWAAPSGVPVNATVSAGRRAEGSATHPTRTRRPVSVDSRVSAPPDAGGTEAGRDLEPALLALGRWGATRLGEPRPGEIVTPESVTLSLRAVFDPAAVPDLTASWEIRFPDCVLHAVVTDGHLDAGVGPAPDKPDLVITFEPDDLPSYRTLMQAAKCGLVKLEGRRTLLPTFIRVFSPPEQDR